MENIEFNAHVESVFSLMRTLVIKCEAIGIKDNLLLASAGYPVSEDKRQWRYYLNMTGEYHETDELMYVSSIDNGEQILFNKANLDIHLATRRAYQPGSYWYQILTKNYPGQIDLINGIIDPIDIEYAIAAEDYKILRYNKSLVESNEDQLIPGLQRWINGYTQRHFNTDYIHTENLQLPIDLATMYGLMIPLVLIVRLEAYGTRNVSDYHVWNKLNSFGEFRQYRNGISHTQKMWLYRNIEYIRNNLGKNFTLEQLIENLLTPESIPIFHYRTVIDTGEMEDDKGGSPEGVFIKERLNFKELDYDTGERYSNRQILELERGMARDNELLLDYYETQTEPMAKESTYNDLSTKILDSTMEDYTNRRADTLMKTLYHEWIYMCQHKLYDAVVDFVDPLNGNHIRLDTKDALIYWQLLTRKLRGEPLQAIDPFWFQDVMNRNLLSVERFREVGYAPYLLEKDITAIRKLWVPTLKVISPDKFFEQSFQIHHNKWEGKKIYSQYDDLRGHAFTRNCVGRLLESGLYWLHDPEQYPTVESWLEDKELNLDTYNRTDLTELSWNIFTKATGWDVKGIVSLREIQGNLISLMMELSSYTVQYVKNIDDGNTTAENTYGVHLGMTDKNSMSNVGDYLLPRRMDAGTTVYGQHALIEYVHRVADEVSEDAIEAHMSGTAHAEVDIGLQEVIDNSEIRLRLPCQVNLTEWKW